MRRDLIVGQPKALKSRRWPERAHCLVREHPTPPLSANPLPPIYPNLHLVKGGRGWMAEKSDTPNSEDF